MSAGNELVVPASPPPAAGASDVAQYGALAPQILIGAAVIGILSVFLPGIVVSQPAEGVSVSRMPVNDWRGIGCLIAYIGVGVVAAQMLSKKVSPPREQLIGVLIGAGLAAVFAVLFLVAVSNASGSFVDSAVKTGIGAYLNLTAAVAAIGGAVILAKREKAF
ncbi:MAG TPA: hypothetical protein VMZ71_03605 [Gemmataceae bacterium]|nr:hypothetical protein [Gemmataceae bacterium]